MWREIGSNIDTFYVVNEATGDILNIPRLTNAPPDAVNNVKKTQEKRIVTKEYKGKRPKDD